MSADAWKDHRPAPEDFYILKRLGTAAKHAEEKAERGVGVEGPMSAEYRNACSGAASMLRLASSEIERLTDLLHCINGKLIAHREAGIPWETSDLARIEDLCREGLNYPPES